MECVDWHNGSTKSALGFATWVLWLGSDHKPANRHGDGYEGAFGLVDFLLYHGWSRNCRNSSRDSSLLDSDRSKVPRHQ